MAVLLITLYGAFPKIFRWVYNKMAIRFGVLTAKIHIVVLWDMTQSHLVATSRNLILSLSSLSEYMYLSQIQVRLDFGVPVSAHFSTQTQNTKMFQLKIVHFKQIYTTAIRSIFAKWAFSKNFVKSDLSSMEVQIAMEEKRNFQTTFNLNSSTKFKQNPLNNHTRPQSKIIFVVIS
jgi:hypothetical protein